MSWSNTIDLKKLVLRKSQTCENCGNDIAAELIRRGINVITFNQRGITEILEMILTVGRIVGGEAKARELVKNLQAELDHSFGDFA